MSITFPLMSLSKLIKILWVWFMTQLGHFILWTIENIFGLRAEEDALLRTDQIIEKYGYKVELHEVTTDDGFILTLDRIPHGKFNQGQPSKGPIFLQHGIESSSGWWFLLPPEICLPFLLADQGYDVFCGNCRGNEYSRRHKYLLPNQKEFWKFTFHEMGYYDLPAIIDHILKTTGAPRLKSYIAHSMGTTMGFVCLSTRPEYNDKIESMIALSPVAYLQHNQGSLNWLHQSVSDKVMLGAIDHLFFGGPDPVLTWMRNVLCRICKNKHGRKLATLWFAVPSKNDDARNATSEAMSKGLGHMRSGSAFRVFVHFFQLIRTGQFSHFNYGIEKNLQKYGTVSPPLYDLGQVTCPVYALYSVGDGICSPADVRRTLLELGNCVNVDDACIAMKDFQHADFCFSEKAKKLVYDRILDYLCTE